MPATEGTWKILVINPGSTSTKVSLFENETLLFEESIFHDAPELLKYDHVNKQIPFRYRVITEMLHEHGVNPSEIDVFVGRGGSAYPQPGGVTLVDRRLYDDTVNAVGGSEHPAKLGVMLAYEFANEYGRKAYTLNPTNTDEFCDEARLTGIKGIYRVSHSHVLNQKAVAEYHAGTMGREYEDCRFIVCHIDGGISVTAHEHGRMIDGNDAGGGEGPFTPTRMGSLAVTDGRRVLLGRSDREIRDLCSQAGGLSSWFGTSNSDKVHRMVEDGNETAVRVWNAMIYQIIKWIGMMSTPLKGQVDAILLTGGLLRFPEIGKRIEESCSFIAPVYQYPGEFEQEAMAAGAMRILTGEEQVKTYPGKPVWSGFDS